MEFTPEVLAQAEVVLLQGTDQAAALAYTPGETPVTLAVACGRSSEELLWCAQEMNLPLVDVPCGDGLELRELTVGQEIPETAYRTVAQCLALVQRARPGPSPVRVVRNLGKAPTGLKKRLGGRAQDLLGRLEIAQVAVSLGPGLTAGDLPERLNHQARKLELELGLILPAVALASDPRLGSREFAIRAREVEVSRGEVAVEGDWGSLLEALSRAVVQHAWRLLGYRETEALVEALRKGHPGLVRELFPGRFSLSSLRVILRNLLREGLPIRDLAAILEALVECRGQSQDPDQLTEFVRASFGHYLTARYSDSRGVLHALILEPRSELAILSSLRESSSALWLDLDLDASLRILTSVTRHLERAAEERLGLVVLCSPRPRRFLRRLLEPSFPTLPVMAYSEVAPLTEVRTFGLIGS